MPPSPYQQLATRLDSLPNGFPPTADGVELRLLEMIFTPEEAGLAAQLRLTLETAPEVAERIGRDPREIRNLLKGLARKMLITVGKTENGLGYGIMPFVVGIYEMQFASLDAEMAQVFEDYYQKAFAGVMQVTPQFHRIVPVSETIQAGMEINPFESAADIVAGANAWGVVDCICRKQQALIGNPCEHPLDVCMILSKRPGAFDGSPVIQAQTQAEALATLKRAAEAGLVHSVSNTQEDVTYICNCCTCSCGILRGISEMGIANVIARSAFVNQVDEDLCQGCEICVDYCQFNALSLDEESGIVAVKEVSCVGCGVCVPACPDEALSLVRRPEDEILPIPATKYEWREERSQARGLDINVVL